MTFIGKHFTNSRTDKPKPRKIIEQIVLAGHINDTFTIPYKKSELSKPQQCELEQYIQKAPFRDRIFRLSADEKWSSPQPYQFRYAVKQELKDWWWNIVMDIPGTKRYGTAKWHHHRIPLTSTVKVENWSEKLEQLFQSDLYNDIAILNGIKRKDGVLFLPYHENGGRVWTAFQNISREGKKILLPGWDDYDINACAFVVMNHFCTMPAFQDILDNKQDRREELVDRLWIPMKNAKALITSTLFGVRTEVSCSWWSDKPENQPALLQLIPMARIKEIKQIEWFMELVRQSQSARNQIVDSLYEQYHQKGGSGLFKIPHPVGQHLVLKKWDKNRIACFHYMCTELEMIQEIQKLVGTNNVAFLHDGFLSLQHHQSEKLASCINNKLGIKVSYKHEILDA